MKREQGDKRWWQRKDKPHETVYSIARRLAKENPRKALYKQLRALYSDDWGEGTPLAAIAGLGTGPCHRDNVIANAVDAVHSRLAKNRPRPWVVTVGGDWSLQQKAKKSSQWLAGEFERLGTYKLGERALKEALTVGTGCILTYGDADSPRQELVLAENLHVDEQEEENNCVRTLYRTAAVDREVLAERYPDSETEIAVAEPWTEDVGKRDPETSDVVLVVEAWHLPASKRSPGRHVIVVDSETLLDEPWEEEWFPIEFVHWRQVEGRFWGIGLAQSMVGVQVELDGMGQHIAESFHLATNSVWAMTGSKISIEQIDNTPHRIYRYEGTPPTLFSPTPVNDQHLMREDTLIRRAYEMQGISQLGAQSQKPAGIDSGKGLRTLHDIETERFLTAARSYETFYVGLSKKLIAVCEQIVEDGEGVDLEITVGKDMLRVIRYSEIRFGDQPHEIRVFPASKLSSDPQGRIKDVEDLIALQAVGPDEARELLDFPDLDAHNNLRSAKRENVKSIVERALDGEDVADLVSPMVDLPYLVDYGEAMHNRAQMDGAPDDVLENLRAVLGMANSLQQQAAEAAAAQAAAAAPPPAPMGPGPMGPPAPVGAPPGLAAVPPM